MSHSLTSANGSYDEKQIVQKRNNSQLFLSTPIFFVVVVVVRGGGGERVVSGVFFKAGHLLNFPPNRMGTYSR